jgi:hypothetical protein
MAEIKIRKTIHSGYRHGYVLPKGKFYTLFDAKV